MSLPHATFSILPAHLQHAITNACKLSPFIENVCQQYPDALSFITETLELTHCESAVYDAKNNIIYASLIGNREIGDGSIATVDTNGKLINIKFINPFI